MKHQGGIYTIRCSNGRVYVGSAKNLQSRWKEHQARLSQGTHFNPYLQRSYNKYGPGAFTFHIETKLGIYDSRTYFAAENALIDSLTESGVDLFNTARAGGGGWGNKVTPERLDEIRKSISNGLRSYYDAMTPEERKIKYGHFRGVSLSTDRKTKLSLMWKGIPKSDAMKMKLSESQKNLDEAIASARRARMRALGQTRLGKLPANAKKVTISGVTYNSIAAAHKATGIHHKTIALLSKEQHGIKN